MKDRIQQVVELEKQAQAINDEAARQAEQLLIQAEKESRALLEKSRADAQMEARALVSKASVDAEGERVLATAEESSRQSEALAMSNFERAVAYVLDRVAGRE
jgi:vacuolar-type H+-ATPase subunit H